MVLTQLILTQVASTWPGPRAHVTAIKNKYMTCVHNYLSYYTWIYRLMDEIIKILASCYILVRL